MQLQRDTEDDHPVGCPFLSSSHPCGTSNLWAAARNCTRKASSSNTFPTTVIATPTATAPNQNAAATVTDTPSPSSSTLGQTQLIGIGGSLGVSATASIGLGDGAQTTSASSATTTAISTSTSSAPPSPTSSAPSTGGNPLGKHVFAHFMVGIVSTYAAEDWEADIALAQSKGITGFAANIGVDPYTEAQLDLGYAAAQKYGFDMFISFDFNWYQTSDVAGVTSMLARYANHPAQLKVDGKPFVSTFIGDGFDWDAVAKGIGQEIYSIPFWMPTQANADNSGLDGLFSWYVLSQLSGCVC